MRRHLAVLLFFLVVAAAWSWPAPLLDPQRLPVRHFDLLPALWLVDQAPHIGLDLASPDTAWPLGESLARLDSWVLLALSWLLRPLLSAPRLLCLVAWLGPALSALSAERAAAMLGARRPWTLVAGLAYGLSGVAASAALEGQIPHLLAPWLPLCLAMAWRAGDPDGRPLHGLLAGLAAALALLTTAYHGLDAALVLLVLGLRAGRRLPRLLPALVPLLPVLAWLSWAYARGEGDVVEPRRILDLAGLGSASLASLLSWTPAQDLVGHSVGAPLGGLVTVALLLGWRRRQDRWLLALALLGLLLALGPVLRLSSGGAGLPSPLALLWHTPAGVVLRFPVRFAWLTALAGGIVAARLLSEAAPRLPAGARWSLLGLALADVFVVTGMPGRQDSRPVPPALGEAHGAVLDLFPVAAFPEQSDVEMWARTVSCARQVSHQRPTLARCMGTRSGSPRTTVSAWLLPRLLGPAGPPADLARVLAGLGVGEVVVHRDFFRPEDLPRLEGALATALGPPATQTAAGVRFAVPGALAGREAATRALAGLRP